MFPKISPARKDVEASMSPTLRLTTTAANKILAEICSDLGLNINFTIHGVDRVSKAVSISSVILKIFYLLILKDKMGWKKGKIQIKETGQLTGVAVNGNYIITGDGYKGIVKIYQIKEDNVWELLLTEQGEEHPYGNGFGKSVSISGNYAIAGDPTGNGIKGEVRFYEKKKGEWNKTLTVPGESVNQYDIPGSYFGDSVSINGNFAIVGAPHYNVDEDDNGEGKVYFYEKQEGEWKETYSVTGDQVSMFFGNSVSIDGNYAIVGAQSYNINSGDDVNSDEGKVYFYEKQGEEWIENGSFTGKKEKGYLGNSVSISGNYAIVGEFKYSTVGVTNKGKIYFYEKQGEAWIENGSFTGKEKSYFGNSVSISGNSAIVGAYLYDTEASENTGKVYFYVKKENGEWEENYFVTGEKEGGQLGNSVSISGNFTITGAIEASEDKNTLRWYTA